MSTYIYCPGPRCPQLRDSAEAILRSIRIPAAQDSGTFGSGGTQSVRQHDDHHHRYLQRNHQLQRTLRAISPPVRLWCVGGHSSSCNCCTFAEMGNILPSLRRRSCNLLQKSKWENTNTTKASHPKQQQRTCHTSKIMTWVSPVRSFVRDMG